MEIVDFRNFEQFQAYIKQHAQELPYWSTEKIKKFNDKVMKLMEESPEFKEKYEKWVDQSVRKNKTTVVIGGTEEDKRRSQALLELRKYQQKKKKTDMENLIKHKKQYEI